MIQENTPARVGLLELLRAAVGAQFVIPPYQRNYTWVANKEVKQLLEDIKTVLRGERTKHFIGIMIYLERSLSFSMRERSVIDGQQRLTTIFLLLYALKEIMLERGMESQAKSLEMTYLINPFDESVKFKLKPLVTDDSVYQHIVNREFDKIENIKSNVWLNYSYLKEEIKSLLLKFSIDELFTAINKLYLVCVPISSDDYPQKIFESINATGAKLTASDLIRNFMLMPIESVKQEEYYDKYWKELEQLVSVDSKKLESFFRFFLSAKNQNLLNKSVVYKAFTEWFDIAVKELGIEGIFKEVVRYAGYYNTIYIAQIDGVDKTLREPLREYRCILSEMPAPLLMELLAIHNRTNEQGAKLISTEQITEIVTILNSYLMRRSLCGMDTSDISRMFPTLLKEIITECDGDYSNVVEIFKKYLVNNKKNNSQEMPDDKKLVERISMANMYNLRTWLNIFFRKLESKDNPAPVDFSKLSIEHLMPQTATKEWLSMLDTDIDTYNANLNRLGNLTLAARVDNSKMGNKDWTYKNAVLSSTSHLKINEDILNKEKWTLDDIETRTKKLIANIAELYPYYEAKGEIIEKIPISAEWGGALAIGYFYPGNKSVEIEAGSTIIESIPTAEKYHWVESLREELIEDEILIRNEDGQLEFSKNYTLYPASNGTALSRAASLVFHGNKNGWDWWLLENGKPINSIRKAEDFD